MKMNMLKRNITKSKKITGMDILQAKYIFTTTTIHHGAGTGRITGRPMITTTGPRGTMNRDSASMFRSARLVSHLDSAGILGTITIRGIMTATIRTTCTAGTVLITTGRQYTHTIRTITVPRRAGTDTKPVAGPTLQITGAGRERSPVQAPQSEPHHEHAD